MNREELIAHCEKCIVPHNKWSNRDSHSAQLQVYSLMGLLKAGCDFRILPPEEMIQHVHSTIEVEVINIPDFAFMDNFEDDNTPQGRDRFYLPNAQRLAENEGQDWY